VSPTVKTVLIVGGIAAGAFVVAKLVAPAPRGATNLSVFGNSSAASAGIAQGAIAGIANLFSGNASNSSNPSASVPAYGSAGNLTPAEVKQQDAQVGAYDAQSGTVYGIAGIDY
jgi:hypothetical protein